MRSVVVLMSGGIDSFLMAKILEEEYKIHPLYIDYGHLAAKQEKQAFYNQLKYLNLQNPTVIKVQGLYLSNSLTNKNDFINDFYPGRNLLFLVIAAQVAVYNRSERVSLGIISGNRIFPDCTTLFLQQAEQILSDCTKQDILIHTPLSEFSKEEVVKLALELEIPIEMSYSCQKGLDIPCNKCPSCIELENAKRKVLQQN